MSDHDFLPTSRPAPSRRVTPRAVAEELLYAGVVASMLPALTSKLLQAFLPPYLGAVALGIAFAASGLTGVIFASEGLRHASDPVNGYPPVDRYAMIGRLFAGWSALYSGLAAFATITLSTFPAAASDIGWSLFTITIPCGWIGLFAWNVVRIARRQTPASADISSAFTERYPGWAQSLLVFTVIVTYGAPALTCLSLIMSG